jgi:hypothetical protein
MNPLIVKEGYPLTDYLKEHQSHPSALQSRYLGWILEQAFEPQDLLSLFLEPLTKLKNISKPCFEM